MARRQKVTASLGASLIVLSSVFYASYGIWATLMGDFFGSFTVSALRCLLVMSLLLIFILYRKEWQKINWRRDGKWLALMVVAAIFVSGPMYYSILHVGISISLALNYVGFVLGAFFFGWLLEKERYTRAKLISTLLGILGLGLVFSPNLRSLGWLALTAAFVSGVAGGTNTVLTKKIPYGATQSTALIWGSGLISFPFIFVFHETLPSMGWHAEWGYFILFALASLVASWTYVRGLKLIEAGAAGILGLLEVVFAVLFGVILFHERPSAIVLLGITTIIMAAAIPYLQHYNAQKGSLEA